MEVQLEKEGQGGKETFLGRFSGVCPYLNRGQEDSRLHLLGAFPPPEAAQTQDPKASPTTNEACQAIFPFSPGPERALTPTKSGLAFLFWASQAPSEGFASHSR